MASNVYLVSGGVVNYLRPSVTCMQYFEKEISNDVGRYNFE